MNKETIVVPKGIRYMSEWKEFNIPAFPCIIDKKIPGCGFTEYCISNPENIILCSPRKILLENKENQHPDEILYVKNELDQDETTDKDLEKRINKSSMILPTKLIDITPEERRKEIIENLKNQITTYTNQCLVKNKPVKILVTYDSFRLVKETLGEFITNFRVVIDEFQSIFTDSRFKSDTELSFIYHLRDLQRVCFVSATPMIDSYLEQLDEFKDLPYFELDWVSDDPLRVLKPDLKARVCRSINEPAYDIIEKYLKGDYESLSFRDSQGNIQTIQSKEVVFYVNSVSNILGIINKCGLTFEQCNVLIADTPDNRKKLRRRLGRKWDIGKVPLKGELHKMFTFCTRTVYLGADFYSTNARTVILSDANVETMAVDISLDLPQILGRQRLNENPWKNRAEFYYKTSRNKLSENEFKAYVDEKLRKTYSLLQSYDEVTDKHLIAETYKKVTIAENYKDNYIAVNEHSGRDIFPELNKLVLIAEQRAFDIQQIDYKDRFSVFNTLNDTGLINNFDTISQFFKDFERNNVFKEKMRLLCESNLSESELSVILDQIPMTYKNYYLTVGPRRCKALGYNKNEIIKEFNDSILDIDNIKNVIYQEFKEDENYLLKDIKEKLSEIYNSLGYNKTPKATDLEEYFRIKRVRIKQKEGFKIIKKL